MDPNRYRPATTLSALLALACALALAAPHTRAESASEPPVGTTLEPDEAVTVDLDAKQRAAEREAALERARLVAIARGEREPVRSIPEIDLVAREVLNDFAAVPTRFPGAEAGWRIASIGPADFFAERIILRLMRAGFASGKPCAGEEWSATHGESRVAVRVEKRAVAVLLMTGSSSCSAAAP